MQASIVDLRYNMVEVKKALENSEIVTLTDRGHVIAQIFPHSHNDKNIRVEDHDFFGSLKNESMSVDQVMNKLRGDRYNDL